MIKTVIPEIIYILAIICLPLIILGYILIKNVKYKKQKIAIAIMVTLIIYISNGSELIDNASKIIMTIQKANKEDEIGTDISFLENYEQKMSKNKYISKYDVTQILEIADSKSKEIFIEYIDESSDIDINISNKDDESLQNLIDNLEGDYYKFSYTISDKNEINIKIERYIVQTSESNEKNIETLTGTLNNEIIENINKYYVSDEYENYSFENKINIETEITDYEFKTLKMLLVYNENNYIPVVDNIDEYKLIDSYTVYSTGISITLKEGVTLENEDYTLRLNRYNSNLEITTGYYYYKYEPVVTQTKNSEGNIVLEINFDKTYTISELKNIEIIFN